VKALPVTLQHDVFYAVTYGIHGVFLWALPAMLVAFVLAWFIKEVPLRGRAAAEEPAAPELVA
jgi:hypothetical protein